MKKLALAFALVAALATVGMAAPINVTVSIPPQKFFVERIAQDLATVNVMVAPGGSPATYEPKPRQMADLENTAAYFAIGVPFEASWLPRFAAANPSMRIVHTEQGIDKIPMAAHSHHPEGQTGLHDHRGHGHAHGHAEILDPHVWLSPLQAKIIALNIRDGFKALDAGNSGVYDRNCDALVKELEQMHEQLRLLFAESQLSSRTFMVFHPAWGYFAQDYGLEQVPIEVSGSEPSPRELTGLIQLAREERIRAIFVQPQFSKRSAETIADHIDAEVVVADPLAEDWVDNLLSVAKAFQSTLQ
ncbi:MAG: metal ABC transporter solute-binding protein, Zn/Mn family [Desulfovibrionales bacterium]